VEALRQVRSWNAADAVVTVPDVHYYDKGANVIIMDDCGEDAVNLKMLIQIALASAIGNALGEFLGQLHTRGREIGSSLTSSKDNRQAREVYAMANYGRLIPTVTGTALINPPLDIPSANLDVLRDLATETAKIIETSRETFTMGDFWPGNIMISLGKDMDGSPRLERIYVVDWELARLGSPAFDLGQFFAEMNLLRRFHTKCVAETSAVIQAFLATYRRVAAVDNAFARLVLVHIGAHLVCWTPRIPWGDKGRTKQVVAEGLGYLLQGYSGSLDHSPVAPLL
jgi:5-methylthioribose kinase